MVNTFWTALGASSIAAIVTTLGIYVIQGNGDIVTADAPIHRLSDS